MIKDFEPENLHSNSNGEPFRWDEVRRAQLCAELDAYYARLYGLTRDELRYTLRVDPKEVHGDDFPGETFHVLKEKEVRLYGDAPQSGVKAGVGGVGWAGERMKAE